MSRGLARARLAVLIPLLVAIGEGVSPRSLSAPSSSDVSGADVLAQMWPGVRDSSEQVVVTPERGLATFSDQEERRVRTVIARVQVPWLGLRILYLEEFLHDEPGALRRQLLLKVDPDPVDARRVRVSPFVFKDPERWRHLNRSPRLLAALRASDLQATEGCDLLFHQEGDQFRGGTSGLDCEDDSSSTELYVDYRMVIGADLYWYRRRLFRVSDDELVEEVMGYNWFSPNEARLFTCRVQWSATGKTSDLRELARVDVHDQGGRARFAAPDGRRFELGLHSDDWPFAGDRDALILMLEQPNSPAPVASAWTARDAQQISIDLGWMKIRCGPLVSENNDVAS